MPVFAILEARLGFDPTKSQSNAAEAAKLLEQDTALQGLVEQSLAPLLEGQALLSKGQEKIRLILEGNDNAVAALAADVKVTVDTLTRGVDLSKGSQDALAATIATRILTKLERRGEEEEKRSLERNRRFKQHVSRTQARAVELLTERKFDRATDELLAGLGLLESLIAEDPGDTHLVVQLGYFFKTIAQDFIRQGDVAQGEAYNDRSLGIFGYVAYQLPHTATRVRDYTDAINGIGNIQYARGRHRVAADYYRLATAIDPLYCYAWHDLFLALYEQARSGGEVDLPGMRRALDMTRRTGSGQPGLSKQHLNDMAHLMEAMATSHGGRKARIKKGGGDKQSQPEEELHVDESTAFDTLERARRISTGNPNDAEAQLVAAQTLVKYGQAGEALAAYEAAARLKPNSFRAASGRGAILGWHEPNP